MPLYEYYGNAENYVELSDDQLKEVVVGNKDVFDTIINISETTKCIAIDGWYGVNWNVLLDGIAKSLKNTNKTVEFINIYDVFKPIEFIESYQKKFETEDPSFGWVNSDGIIEDIMDVEKINKLKNKIQMYKGKSNSLVVVYGPGAAINILANEYDLIFYADFTMQPMLWQMWDGKLVPFGYKEPKKDYYWKKYYYNDFYLLYRNKKNVFKKMNYYIDATESENLKMLPSNVYNYMIDELVKQPIKQVKILQPGPWGAYRYKDLWNVPGLECNAWNELAGIELSVRISIKGLNKIINIPSQNIMQRPIQLVGEYVNNNYPDLFPLQVWLDDGYFEEEMPYERTSMPIHDHPSTDYVKRHFNEPLGRYETYYIVEAYKGATTWMGYRDDADLEEWERLCRASNNMKKIPNWQDFIKRWDTNVGDLFLIPPGTSHGHGGNQMILEMDTGPSVVGTEYSFFTFDYARNTWDDKTKTMTGKPMKMHLDHSFNNNKWVRETRVKDYHRARPIVVEGNGKYRKDRYTTLPEMPFHIERLFFEKTAENDTEGKYMMIVVLTEGTSVTIRSISEPKYQTTIERLQACIIPAGFGKHEYINEDGKHAMVVMIRLKQG
jgi:hypothetical protein